MNSPRAIIEIFHLLFLRYLGGRLDKRLYALKGGCNLRFFFKSIRYSEDIDFDVATISTATLKNKVDKILESVDFRRVLQSKEIEIIQISAGKQTDTTQRWKLLLRYPGSTLAVPTKIEFSRRTMGQKVAYEAIDGELIRHYHLYPILCNHYDREAAFFQKIDALINRTQTQARDIFDLKWLLDQGTNPDKSKLFSDKDIILAVENIEQISYTDFKGHVVAFLMEEYRDFYDSEEKWQEIQTQVTLALRGEKS